MGIAPPKLIHTFFNFIWKQTLWIHFLPAAFISFGLHATPIINPALQAMHCLIEVTWASPNTLACNSLSDSLIVLKPQGSRLITCR